MELEVALTFLGVIELLRFLFSIFQQKYCILNIYEKLYIDHFVFALK